MMMVIYFINSGQNMVHIFLVISYYILIYYVGNDKGEG